MVVEQAVPIEVEEQNQLNEIGWSVADAKNQNAIAHSEDQEIGSLKNEPSPTRFEGLISVGQKVFLIDDQAIGRIGELVPGDEGRTLYLVVRPAHFWDRQKIVPVENIRSVNPMGTWLSLDRNKFQDLPDYKTDASIAADVDRALWNDEILRVTDYREIGVRVKNGVVSLSGHILGAINQDRVDRAIQNVKGILGVRNHLVADDKLLLKVVGALVETEQTAGNHIFVKVQNGMVVLSGTVISASVRALAEKLAADIPEVRAVINGVTAPGIDLHTEDQRFFQPSIGEEILFRDSLFGFVKLVIINPANRMVIAMVIQGRFPDVPRKFRSLTAGETQSPERLAVIPTRVLRYLTNTSGFLLIDSTETTEYQDYDPAKFTVPNSNWVPPYPYSRENIRFFAE